MVLNVIKEMLSLEKSVLSWTYMTSSLSPRRAGLALGILFAAVHLIWSLFVALNLAQPLMDFVLQIHMLQVPVKALPFSFGNALGLIVITGVIGYVMGCILAWLWNKAGKSA